MTEYGSTEHGSTEHDSGTLATALRELGTRLHVPEPPDPDELTASVRARLARPAPRAGHPVLLRVAAVLVVAMLALAVLVAVSPPVRAGVLNLLRFAGIELRTDSAPPASLPPIPAPLPDQRVVDLAAAHREARFPVAVPDVLGPPEQVLLIDGTPPRVVSLLYRGGTVRLDQFDGRFDITVYKKLASAGGVEWVPYRTGSDPAVWVDRPHEVVYVDRDGNYRTESARLSGRTLIWQAGDITLRLEGELTLAQALDVARSVR